MASPHKVEQALRTNHFVVCVPDRPELSEFTTHARYVDITEHPKGGADVIVGIVHPIHHPELPRAIKEGNVTFIQIELYADQLHEQKIYTMQFEECSLMKVHRRLDCHIHEPVMVEYTFHAEQVDVMVEDETDDIDRSNWSDTPERRKNDERMIPKKWRR